MRTLILSILTLFMLDLSAANTPPTYYIPSAGQTINNLGYFDIASQTFYVTTSGSVNLSSHTYVLTYASLPPANTTWNVIFDATNLTVTSGSVNLFGETPLSTYPKAGRIYYIQFSVVWEGGSPTLKSNYFSSLADLNAGNFPSLTVTGPASFYGTIHYPGLGTPDAVNNAVIYQNDSTLGKGCPACAWSVNGNSGLSASTNFLGTLDATDLVFKVNGAKSGLIDSAKGNTSLGFYGLNANTSGNANTAIGYFSMYSNTTGASNVSIGQAMIGNTTGSSNVAIGNSAIGNNTTGGDNIGVGAQALSANTTASNNTSIGYQSGSTFPTTGGFNTLLGSGTNTAASNSAYAVAIGANATASSNQIAFGPNLRSLYLQGFTSGVGYVLTDTSGTGNFVSRLPVNSQTLFTPVTGDSVSVTTRANIIKPAGTISNFTIILPASPVNGEVHEFSFTQIVTTLHWSTAANQSNSVDANVPTATTAGKVFSIQFNGTIWYLY